MPAPGSGRLDVPRQARQAQIVNASVTAQAVTTTTPLGTLGSAANDPTDTSDT